jgi:Na+/H+ antiporter NhaD/arsenite permease-like protein
MGYEVNPWMVLPFILLLLAIALMPFIHRHWWERFYPAVAIGLGCVTVIYYVFMLDAGGQVLHTAHEYLSFICLIGSLFVVSGGIHIKIKGKSKPLANVFLLAVGAVVANVLGTTGASMILIRPFIRVNRYRIKPYHIVFFIFVVSNMGGALTPIGDPPLFLGYLRGIPFFWVVENLWVVWVLSMSAVLAVFYVIDYTRFRRLSASVRHGAEGAEESGEVSGLQNIFFLAVILVSVFVSEPPFLREALMVAAAVGSYLMTGKDIHEKNDFDFHPIREVAFLFLGIFATMIPALDWLRSNADTIGITTPGGFFWATGALSSFLDNAPTYLNFLNASIGLFVGPDVVDRFGQIISSSGGDLVKLGQTTDPQMRSAMAMIVQHHYEDLVAGSVKTEHLTAAYLLANHAIYVKSISIAAVFFGAMTYIGNGPNFMVKSIAEQQGVRCPSFFGYLFRFAVPVLVPVFILDWLIFFR